MIHTKPEIPKKHKKRRWKRYFYTKKIFVWISNKNFVNSSPSWTGRRRARKKNFMWILRMCVQVNNKHWSGLCIYTVSTIFFFCSFSYSSSLDFSSLCSELLKGTLFIHTFTTNSDCAVFFFLSYNSQFTYSTILCTYIWLLLLLLVCDLQVCAKTMICRWPVTLSNE